MKPETEGKETIKYSIPLFHSIPWLLGWVSLTVMGPFVLAKVAFKTFQVIMSKLVASHKNLKGKVVLITGASSGLGEALAHLLYKSGCRIILVSRNMEYLENLKKKLIDLHKPPELHLPIIVHLDLEDLNSIPQVANKIISTYGHVDILINNAGISSRGDVLSTQLSVDLKLMVVNYFGQVALTKAILKKMVARRSGHIVGISSLQGLIAIPFRSSYGASKHAFGAFLDTLRAEVAHLNIDVTVIYPSYIQTNLSINALTSSGDTYGEMDDDTARGMTPEKVSERIISAIKNKEKEVVISPFLHKLVVYIRAAFPSLFFYIMKRRANRRLGKLPRNKQD